jgi:ribosomal protein L5
MVRLASRELMPERGSAVYTDKGTKKKRFGNQGNTIFGIGEHLIDPRVEKKYLRRSQGSGSDASASLLG